MGYDKRGIRFKSSVYGCYWIYKNKVPLFIPLSMHSLVEGVLQFSRVDSDEEEMKYVDIDDVLNDVI